MYIRMLSEWLPNSLGLPCLHHVGKENVSTEELAANHHTIVPELQLNLLPWSWNFTGSYKCSCSHSLKWKFGMFAIQFIYYFLFDKIIKIFHFTSNCNGICGQWNFYSHLRNCLKTILLSVFMCMNVHISIYVLYLFFSKYLLQYGSRNCHKLALEIIAAWIHQ